LIDLICKRKSKTCEYSLIESVSVVIVFHVLHLLLLVLLGFLNQHFHKVGGAHCRLAANKFIQLLRHSRGLRVKWENHLPIAISLTLPRIVRNFWRHRFNSRGFGAHSLLRRTTYNSLRYLARFPHRIILICHLGGEGRKHRCVAGRADGLIAR
jgi:hypothetical protein